jgi:N-acetylneuraminic acid mutarotase
MKDFPGNCRTEGTSFSINGKGYVGLGHSYSDYYKDMWEYDPTNDAWKRLSDFPGSERASFVTLIIDSKAYIITGTNGEQYDSLNNISEVWEFDPSIDQWIRKKDFPGGSRWSAFGFVINHKGYMGGGVSGNYNRLYDFWKYDAGNDLWIQRNDITEEIWEQYNFGISDNNFGYVVTGTKGNFVRYDEVKDSWENIKNVWANYGLYESTGFLLKGKICFGQTGFLEYDPITLIWNNIYPNYKGQMRNDASSFSIGDFGYVLLGGYYNNGTKDVWRLDPTKPVSN